MLNRFKASGIVEVNLKGISLKKEFIFKKNAQELRFDVINSGIFALMASPFASAYVGNGVKVTNYENNFFEDIELPIFPLQSYLDLEAFSPEFLDEIVKNKKINIAFITFNFNDQYQVESIQAAKQLINLDYDRMGGLEKVEFSAKKANIKLLFDTFVKGDFDIKRIK
jgi:hypothetical protein